MQRPLTGVRVLDLSQFLAGPYGSMILGDLGAEVLKIEIPGRGDGSREMPPHFVHGQSGYFLSMNRSKQSMTLDLKHPAGLEIFYELVRRSDVVYDNFRPGILERLRIDYDDATSRSTGGLFPVRCRAMARPGRAKTVRRLTSWCRPWAAS